MMIYHSTIFLSLALFPPAVAFAPPAERVLAFTSSITAGTAGQHHHLRPKQPQFHATLNNGDVDKTNGNQNEDDAPTNNSNNNPYADPNYPDLEFINYDDPNYSVDQGLEDDYYDDESSFEMHSDEDDEDTEDRTLVEIEAMRESRRKRNDEYQFETYHAKVLRGGQRSLGEWTIFQTDTFMGKEVVQGRHPEALGVPRLLKWDKVLKVVSLGTKISVDGSTMVRKEESEDGITMGGNERIVHDEKLATYDDFPTLMMSEENEDDEDGGELNWESKDREHVEHKYWPKEMAHLDFRGPGGNMCVGKAYTICDATPLVENTGEVRNNIHDGPFSEMRTELGISDNGMRFRIKLDYALLDEDVAKDAIGNPTSAPPPPLHLRTLTVCRETLDGYWPRPSDNEVEMADDDSGNKESKKSEVRRKNQDEITRALFGPPGAPGGLYDPPPVGSEERAIENYMLLDFEGGATVLLPHKLDQCHNTVNDGGETSTTREDSSLGGWVTSLDWTPGRIRYQVDRKVLSGIKLKGLRTLELSEVQGEDADRWRPKDGGANMRQ
ncbi:hypothetical protein ACHAWU_002642 [Discostella pseudostelligera]|uniref:Uncharacterized protein n=1 Tax=Discostella pseudostelligera TaxID=259834 RepID=A0ABD3LWC9_9STRA